MGIERAARKLLAAVLAAIPGLSAGQGPQKAARNDVATESIAEFEAALARLLKSAARKNRVNVLDVAEVRESIAETHREAEADARAHGEAGAGEYWDLTMVDRPEEPAVFAFWIWRARALSVFTGSGDGSKIKNLCEGSGLEEIDEILPAMEKEFHVSRSVAHLSRRLAEEWVSKF